MIGTVEAVNPGLGEKAVGQRSEWNVYLEVLGVFHLSDVGIACWFHARSGLDTRLGMGVS